MNETVTQNEKECKLNNRKLRQKPSGLVAGGERCTKRLRETLQARGLGLGQTRKKNDSEKSKTLSRFILPCKTSHNEVRFCLFLRFLQETDKYVRDR